MPERFGIKRRVDPEGFENSSFELALSIGGAGLNSLAKRIVQEQVLGRKLEPGESVKCAIKNRRGDKGNYWWNQVRDTDETIYAVGIAPETIKIWEYMKVNGQWNGLDGGHVGDDGALKEIVVIDENNVNAKQPEAIYTPLDIELYEE